MRKLFACSAILSCCEVGGSSQQGQPIRPHVDGVRLQDHKADFQKIRKRVMESTPEEKLRNNAKGYCGHVRAHESASLGEYHTLAGYLTLGNLKLETLQLMNKFIEQINHAFELIEGGSDDKEREKKLWMLLEQRNAFCRLVGTPNMDADMDTMLKQSDKELFGSDIDNS